MVSSGVVSVAAETAVAAGAASARPGRSFLFFGPLIFASASGRTGSFGPRPWPLPAAAAEAAASATVSASTSAITPELRGMLTEMTLPLVVFPAADPPQAVSPARYQCKRFLQRGSA